MNEGQSATIHQLIGQVLSMFSLLDQPMTMLTIESDGQSITVRATGPIAL